MMKKIPKIVILFLSITVVIFSQSTGDKYYISGTLLGGVFIPHGDAAYYYESGLNGGVEIQYGNKNRAVFIGVTYNSFKFKGSHIRDFKNILEYSLVNESNSSQTEIAGGLRFYVGEENLMGFVEAGLGSYIRKRNAYTESYRKDTVQYVLTPHQSSSSQLWFNVGLGITFAVKKNIWILVKPKLHISGEGEKIITTSGFYAGIKYDF